MIIRARPSAGDKAASPKRVLYRPHRSRDKEDGDGGNTYGKPFRNRVGFLTHRLAGVAAEIVNGRRPFIGRHSSSFDSQLKIARAVMHA